MFRPGRRDVKRRTREGGASVPGLIALKVTKSPLLAASSSNVPDLDEARARLAPRSR